MRKSFFFLLLMVLVLPSLGLTSAKAFFEWMATKNTSVIKFRWKCIFLPDNGAFFVNYVITSAFIGTAAELVRLPELFLYAIKLTLARSAAERTSVRKSVLWEFQFGAQYAWMLCVFAVVMAFSITCPLITPFGLLYLLMKHTVDRYNIYFAYGPSKINKYIHASAVNFVIMSVIILQFAVVFFDVLRAEQLQGITIFSSVALLITLLIMFGRLCFGWFRGLSPIAYKKFGGSDSELPVVAPVPDTKPFIPIVLLPEDRDGDANRTNSADTEDATNTRSSLALSYGATGSHPHTPESARHPQHQSPADGDSFVP